MNSKTLSIIIKAQDQASKVLEQSGGKIQSALSKMVTVAKWATATVGAVFTGMLGKFVIGGGISRALNIEDAQAKLRGLGHDVESVETIMKSALASVKGTKYGLDEAATAAASAVAAGVKPGKELTRYLSIAADTATIAGTSFGEMGSIFGKVQTQQRAYTQELNQLADRGIPIYQWLQSELGITQEKLREMVSAGKLDAETYFKVIEKNIGGAALESGKTTRGAWDNMRAAMARVGEAIVKDIIPRVRDAFGSIGKWFDANSDTIVGHVKNIASWVENLARKVVDVARQIGNYLAPKIQDLKRAIENILPTIMVFVQSYVIPMAQILGTVLVGAIGLAIDALRIITQVLQPVINWLNQNRAAVVGLVVALGALAVALKIQALIQVVDTAIAALRMSFVVTAATTLGLSGSISALSVSMGALFASIGPVGWILGAVSAAAGLVAYNYSRAKDEANKLTDAQNTLRDASKALNDAQSQGKQAALNLEGAGLRVEEATKAQADAIKRYGGDSLEARQATHNLKQANQDLADAQKRVAETSGDIIEASVAEDLARERVEVEKTKNEYKKLADAKKDASKSYGGQASSFGFNFGGARAGGGDVTAGRPYLVGEHEPELFVPKQSGEILNQKQMRDAGITGNTTFNMFGNVTLGDASAVDRYFNRIDKMGEMAAAGVGV